MKVSKIVKFISLVLAVASICACFASCGGSNDSAKDSGTTTAAKPKLVMGTNAAFPPYEFKDDSGKIVGIDAEVAQLIADKLGMELEIKDMDFDGIIAAVQGGSIDMGMAGMTVTDERKKSVNFTDSYAKGIQVIIVNEDSSIKSADDLKGKKIGVQASTTGDIYATEDFGEENVKRYEDGAAAVAALTSKVVDAVIIDNEPAKEFVKANQGTKILETSYADEDYAIAVSKDNKDLLEKINNALNELKNDGSVQKIVDKYITSK